MKFLYIFIMTTFVSLFGVTQYTAAQEVSFRNGMLRYDNLYQEKDNKKIYILGDNALAPTLSNNVLRATLYIGDNPNVGINGLGAYNIHYQIPSGACMNEGSIITPGNPAWQSSYHSGEAFFFP